MPAPSDPTSTARRALSGVALSATLLAACGGTFGDLTAESSPTGPCEPAPAPVVKSIEDSLIAAGVTRDGATVSEGLAEAAPVGGLVVSDAAMAKVGPNRWAVAAEVDGPGLDGPGHVGVWAVSAGSGGIESGGGLYVAADDIAARHSIYPDGLKVPEGSPASTKTINTIAVTSCLS